MKFKNIGKIVLALICIFFILFKMKKCKAEGGGVTVSKPPTSQQQPNIDKPTESFRKECERLAAEKDKGKTLVPTPPTCTYEGWSLAGISVLCPSQDKLPANDTLLVELKNSNQPRQWISFSGDPTKVGSLRLLPDLDFKIFLYYPIIWEAVVENHETRKPYELKRQLRMDSPSGPFSVTIVNADGRLGKPEVSSKEKADELMKDSWQVNFLKVPGHPEDLTVEAGYIPNPTKGKQKNLLQVEENEVRPKTELIKGGKDTNPLIPQLPKWEI